MLICRLAKYFKPNRFGNSLTRTKPAHNYAPTSSAEPRPMFTCATTVGRNIHSQICLMMVILKVQALSSQHACAGG